MTGCSCLVVIAAIVGLLWVFVRGSFDAGEPIDTAVALVVIAVLAIQRWQRKWTAHELVRARRA